MPKLKYWVEEYDGFTIFMNQNTEASDKRGVETIYHPGYDNDELMESHIEKLENLGFVEQEPEGVEENIKRHIDRHLKD